MAGPRAAVLLCLALLAAGQAAGQAASDITLSGVTVALLEAGGSEAHSNSVMGPTMMHLGTLDHTRTLKVELSAALAGEPDFRPQQAFVRLTSRASGAAAYFAAVKAKAGKLYATAKVADLQKQVGQQGGAYDVALLVGDARSAQPLDWALGFVTVLLPPLDDGSQPQDKPYRLMDSLFTSRPEITHQHRQPEKRTPAIISLAFTAVIVAPLAGFVAAAARVGANLKGFPTDGAGFVAAAGFHGGLAAICALYLLFFVKLNLMQTVPILAALGVATTVFGGSTLRGLAAQQGSKPAKKQD